MKIKVKCINSRGLNGALTKGKVYEVINSWSDFYIVINDNGIQDTYAKNRFEVVTVHIGLDIGISEPIIQETRVVRKIEELDGLENGFGLSIDENLNVVRKGFHGCYLRKKECITFENDKAGLNGYLGALKCMGFKFEYKPKKTEKEIMNGLVEKEFKFGEGNFILIKLENGKWDYMNNTSHYVPDKKYYTLESAKVVVRELNELLESENNV